MDLLRVEKPARYMGGEMGSVVKADPGIRVALAFPDVYEVGMSHLGLRILYNILNRVDGVAAERVYAPWPDMASLMEAEGIPLKTLESSTPLAETDILGFTLQYELSCTNILSMLRQSGIPWRAAERGLEWPLVIGGGPGAYNPEPIAAFFDLFLLGDGEEAILDIVEQVRIWKAQGGSKAELLDRLEAVQGVYIPSRFELDYNDDGTVASIRPLSGGNSTIRRRFVADIEGALFPEDPVIPFMKTIHDRVAMEIARGCTRGCRFCQAGYVYRPLRERSQEKIVSLVGKALAASGYDEISLLSLSTGDYSCIATLLQQLMKDYSDNRVAVSLPSLRVGTLTGELIDEIRKVRKTGFTLAPEAGSERMRQVINKGISEEDLLKGAQDIFAAGWRIIKLYFMMGLPGETEEDLLAIPDLARQVKDQAKRVGGHGEVNVAVSTFVPKPHTPFQWERQISLEETRERQRLLRDALKRRRLNYKYQEAELSFLEGVIARGDRRLSVAIERAVELGCRFDGWREHFSLLRWQQAFHDVGIDPEWYLRGRSEDEILPWSHLDAGVSQHFLKNERQLAFAQIATEDCRNGSCTGCGVCDFKELKNRQAVNSKVSSRHLQGKSRPGVIQRRIRIRFAKVGQMRYLSHLELINVFTRALHRAGVPMLYSQGFHPHPRFSFAMATSVGIESRAEYLDLFVDRLGAADVMERLNKVLPQGLYVMEALEVPLKTDSLSTLISGTRYRVHLPLTFESELSAQCVQFMAQTSWNITRAKKRKPEQSFDLRLEVKELFSDGAVLGMLIGRGKPLEVASAVIGVAPEDLQGCCIEKLELIFAESAESLSSGENHI